MGGCWCCLSTFNDYGYRHLFVLPVIVAVVFHQSIAGCLDCCCRSCAYLVEVMHPESGMEGMFSKDSWSSDLHYEEARARGGLLKETMVAEPFLIFNLLDPQEEHYHEEYGCIDWCLKRAPWL